MSTRYAVDFTKRWMSGVADAQYLTQLTIPGTHDSHATYSNFMGDHYARGDQVVTQKLEIKEQLEMGVRYLDLRCGDDDYDMAHGNVRLKGHLWKILDVIGNFLDENKTETVMVSIQWDTTGSEPKNMSTRVGEYWGRRGWYSEKDWPSLEKVRGRAVLLRRFRGDIGIDLSWFYGDQYKPGGTPGDWSQQDDGKFTMQGKYDAGVGYWNEGINELWTRCWKHLDFAVDATREPPRTMYFTVLSAFSLNYGNIIVANYMNPHIKRYCAAPHKSIDGTKKSYGTIVLDGMEPANAWHIMFHNWEKKIFKDGQLNHQGFGEIARFSNGIHVIFQDLGNLVVYDGKNTPLWHSNTHGSGATSISFYSWDGLQLKNADKKHIWKTGPAHNENMKVTFMSQPPYIVIDEWEGAGDILWTCWSLPENWR